MRPWWSAAAALMAVLCLGSSAADAGASGQAGADDADVTAPYTIIWDDAEPGTVPVRINICLPAKACPPDWSQHRADPDGAGQSAHPPGVGGAKDPHWAPAAPTFAETTAGLAEAAARGGAGAGPGADVQAVGDRELHQEEAIRRQTEAFAVDQVQAWTVAAETAQIERISALEREVAAAEPDYARERQLRAASVESAARMDHMAARVATRRRETEMMAGSLAVRLSALDAAAQQAVVGHNEAYEVAAARLTALRAALPRPADLDAPRPPPTTARRSAALQPFTTAAETRGYDLLTTAHDYWEAAEAAAAGREELEDEADGYLELAAIGIERADALLASAQVNEGSAVLDGVMALIDDVFDLDAVIDRVTAGSTFAAGVVHGATLLPGQPMPGYTHEWEAGTLLGRAIGLHLEAHALAGLVAAATPLLSGGGLALAAGAVVAPAAATLASVATVGVVAEVVLIGQHVITAMKMAGEAEKSPPPELNECEINQRRIYLEREHFNKHGRGLGYKSTKDYRRAAHAFFLQHIRNGDAKIYRGLWRAGGMYKNKWQFRIEAEGLALIVGAKSGQIVDFFAANQSWIGPVLIERLR